MQHDQFEWSHTAIGPHQFAHQNKRKLPISTSRRRAAKRAGKQTSFALNISVKFRQSTWLGSYSITQQPNNRVCGSSQTLIILHVPFNSSAYYLCLHFISEYVFFSFHIASLQNVMPSLLSTFGQFTQIARAPFSAMVEWRRKKHATKRNDKEDK